MQDALEHAKVCLLCAGPTGSEALKNMVLGGIDAYTIVDGARVGPADLGNNFFVTADSLAGSRAQCVTECMNELNESVAGSYVEEDPAALIASNPAFFKQFDLVIASQVRCKGGAVSLSAAAAGPAAAAALCLEAQTWAQC
jgi:amyloid beta precursor protein binding protein 1